MAHLLGTVSLTPSLGSSPIYQTLGADPWLILLLWGLLCWQWLVLLLCRSSQWWEHWQRADTAAACATTGVEPFLPLWASLSASAVGWYHRHGVHFLVVLLVLPLCSSLRSHCFKVMVSPHWRWAGYVFVGFAM